MSLALRPSFRSSAARRVAVAAAASLATMASDARADSYYWTGGGLTANWTNIFNWFEASVPAANDDIYFDGVVTRTTSVVNQSFTLNQIGFVSGTLGETESFNINRTNNAVLTVSDFIFNAVTDTQTFAVPIALGGNLNVQNVAFDGDPGGGRLVFNEYFSLGANTLFVQPQSNATIELNAPVNGTGGVTLVGPGTLKLGGSNTFTGGLLLYGGTVTFAAGPNLGAVGNRVTFAPAAGEYAILHRTASGITSSPITLASGEARFETAADWTLTGNINGGGDFTKTGSGSLTLTGTTTHTGPTRVVAGSLNLSGNARLPDAAVHVNAGARLSLIASDTVGSLRGGGTVVVGTGSTFTIGATAGTNPDTNGTGTFNGNLTGLGRVAIGGSGVVTLAGNASDYAGFTSVNAGSTLAVNNFNGSATGVGIVSVHGTLAGAGVIGGYVNVGTGGRISPSAPATPGSGNGKLTVGELSLATGSAVRIELNGITAAVNVDQLLVTGDAGLTGGTLSLVKLANFNPALGAFPAIPLVKINGTRFGTFATVEGAILNGTQALAVTYDDHNVLVQLARPGDATLDGAVNFTDLVVLAQNYDASAGGRTWTTGDFDGTGTTAFADLVILAQNYGFGALSGAQADALGTAFAADWALAQGLVPEPTTLAAAGLASAAASRRRRVV